MKRSRFSQEQIIGTLQEQEAGNRRRTCAESSGSRAPRSWSPPSGVASATFACTCCCSEDRERIADRALVLSH